MIALMQAEGLPYQRREKTFNSRLAQELGKLGDQLGATRIHDALYRAYFVDGLNLAKNETLLPVAESVGIPKDQAQLALAERTMRNAVDQDWARSRALGVTGVPTFVIANRALVGAQPYEALEQFARAAGAKPRV
jgi:predicted DsbA family dithiol-disulfide isomerase